jgi:dienelactone hydrolase
MEKYQAYHYLNATHAFDIPWTSERKVHGFTVRHDKEATELSKRRMFEFLDSTIKD